MSKKSDTVLSLRQTPFSLATRLAEALISVIVNLQGQLAFGGKEVCLLHLPMKCGSNLLEQSLSVLSWPHLELSEQAR